MMVINEARYGARQLAAPEGRTEHQLLIEKATPVALGDASRFAMNKQPVASLPDVGERLPVAGRPASAALKSNSDAATASDSENIEPVDPGECVIPPDQENILAGITGSGWGSPNPRLFESTRKRSGAPMQASPAPKTFILDSQNQSYVSLHSDPTQGTQFHFDKVPAGNAAGPAASDAEDAGVSTPQPMEE